MGRKNEGILNLLTELPWWVSVIVSATVFVSLKWLLPSIQIDNIFLKGITQASPNLAIPFALLLLMPAPLSALNSWRKKRLLDKQKGIDSIRRLSWKEFEEMVAEFFRRKGYSVIENSSTGPDGGVDVTLKKNGNLFLVQCKQWKAQKVGVQVVREMFGVMTAEQATGVIVITSGFFTQEAQRFSAGKPIELIEGGQLASLVKSVQAEKGRPAKIITASESPNRCPRCGNELVLRTAHRGQNAGSKFFGCTGYPTCRYTKAFQG